MTVKKLATIGNSFGVIIDRPMLRLAGIDPGANVAISVEDGAVIVRLAPTGRPRTRRGDRLAPDPITLDKSVRT